MTFASLGLAIDSGRVVTAAADLDKLTAATGRAQQGADRLAKSYGDAGSVVARINQMMAGGSGGASAHIAAFGNELDRLRQKFNPLYAEQRRFAAVTEEISRAQRMGALTAHEATAALAREQAAFNSATAAMQANTRAANDNRAAHAARAAAGGGAVNANALNLGFQAQDIAMMTLAGQAPAMLALQQGMQVGGIFSQMGGGRAIVQGLGSAIGMLLNPLNLATIAIIGFGAAGVQAFMNMAGGAEDATTALERHRSWLDETLVGYGDLRDAADAALEASLKLPEASTVSNIGAQRAEAANSAVAAMERALQLQQDFAAYAGSAEAFGVPDDLVASLESASTIISRLTSDSALSAQELNELHTALTLLGNNTADQNIRDIVAEALALVDAARQAFAEVNNLDYLLQRLDRDIQIRIAVSTEFNSAVGELSDLYIDPRNRFEVMREQAKNAADQAMATAQSYGQAVGAASELERVLASIDQAEAKANEKSGRSAAKAAQKPFNQWETATGNFQRRIEQQQLEISLLGQSTYEIELQRAAFELLNQAKDAGIPITASVTEQINTMSAEYAAATVNLERMTQAANDNAAIWSQAQDGVSSIIKTWARGGDILETISNKLLNIGDMLVDMAVRDLFGAAFGGGGGGGGIFSWLGSLLGLPSFAGGGSTGNGPRVGGLDGRGGYLAMIHPQETVIDHTQPHAADRNGGQLSVRVISEVRGGNLVPVMTEIAGEVSGQQIRQTAPVLVGQAVGQANKSAPAAVAKYQQQRGGADWRTM